MVRLHSTVKAKQFRSREPVGTTTCRALILTCSFFSMAISYANLVLVVIIIKTSSTGRVGGSTIRSYLDYIALYVIQED